MIRLLRRRPQRRGDEHHHRQDVPCLQPGLLPLLLRQPYRPLPSPELPHRAGTRRPDLLHQRRERQRGARVRGHDRRAEGLSLNRIEDGTAARDGGGLWRLTFSDIENPLAGGTLELLLDGSETIGLSKPDNLTVDADGGHILIQEDPGNIAHVARIVAYRIADGATAVVARFDPALFDPAVAGSTLLTRDEESSGVRAAAGLRTPCWRSPLGGLRTPSGGVRPARPWARQRCPGCGSPGTSAADVRDSALPRPARRG